MANNPRAIADNAAASDSLARQASHPRANADGAATTETLFWFTNHHGASLPMSDGSAAADALVRAATNWARANADNAAATDSLSWSFVNALADAAGAADSLSRSSLALVRLLGDGAFATDKLRESKFSSTLFDTAYASDSLSLGAGELNGIGFLDEAFGVPTIIQQPNTNPILPVPPIVTFTPTATVGLLGCGDYEVHIGNRGGTQLLGIFYAKELQWQRTMNTLSAATVKIQERGGGQVNTVCQDVLATINPWQHEIVLMRNGEAVWTGTISANIDYDLSTGEVSIQARDLSAWFDVRRINADYSQDETVALAQAFSFLFNNAYAQDPFNFALVLQNTSLTGQYSIQATQNKYASTELQVITKSSLDYYVLNRRMFAFDIEAPLPAIVNLTDDHFQTYPTVTVSGKVFASSLLVTGSGQGTGGASAVAPISNEEVVDQFGLVDRTFSEPTITDPTILAAAANSRYTLVSQPYIQVAGGSLSYLVPVDMNQLIPGARVLLALQKSIRTVIGAFRLTQLDVQRTATEEKVALTLIPEGAVAAASAGTLLPQNQEAIGGGTFTGV